MNWRSIEAAYGTTDGWGRQLGDDQSVREDHRAHEQDALSPCEPAATKASKRKPVWHDDAELTKWLASL
jgi:hypothetical protein